MVVGRLVSFGFRGYVSFREVIPLFPTFFGSTPHPRSGVKTGCFAPEIGNNEAPTPGNI